MRIVQSRKDLFTMKKTFKRISILASAFLMAVTNLVCAPAAMGAEINVENGYAAETIQLSDAETIAGNQVMVQLSLNTGNQCTGYNLDIEFDSSLTLKDVVGPMAWDVNENVVSIIGVAPLGFKDGTTVATMYFETPENAQEGAAYSIGVQNVGDLVSDLTEESRTIEDYNVKNSTVEVIEEAKAVTNHIVTKKGVGLRGDVNGNGEVDFLDLVLTAQHIAGKTNLPSDAEELGDINGNGRIDFLDLTFVSKYIASQNASWDEIVK